jgi:hypothetical protein
MNACASIVGTVIAAVLSVSVCPTATSALGQALRSKPLTAGSPKDTAIACPVSKRVSRGTEYTHRAGRRRDWGEAALAVVAYIADAGPVCAPLSTQTGTTYVACYATISADRLGLVNVLIASAFALAAIRVDVWPQCAPDVVVEQSRERRAGLWQFRVVECRAIVLGRARQLTGQGQ